MEKQPQTKASILIDAYKKGEIYSSAYVKELEERLHAQAKEIGGLKYKLSGLTSKKGPESPLHISYIKSNIQFNN